MPYAMRAESLRVIGDISNERLMLILNGIDVVTNDL